MNIRIILIFTFGLTYQGMTQNLIRDYKRIADKSLLKYFDNKVASQVKCDRFTISDNDGSSRFIYNENKNKRMVFKTITFRYSIFDKVLNDDIHFYISVNKSHQVTDDSSLFKSVPTCIRTFQICNFISSDSAKNISIADSIKFPNNLSSQLERNKFDKEYYWIITGHKPSDMPKTNKPSLNLYAEGVSSSQRRIVNAKTGQIFSDRQFEYDW